MKKMLLRGFNVIVIVVAIMIGAIALFVGITEKASASETKGLPPIFQLGNILHATHGITEIEVKVVEINAYDNELWLKGEVTSKQGRGQEVWMPINEIPAWSLQQESTP